MHWRDTCITFRKMCTKKLLAFEVFLMDTICTMVWHLRGLGGEGVIWIYFRTAQSLIKKLHFIIYLYTPLSVQEFPGNNTCSRIFGHKGDNGVDDEKCWTSHCIHSTLYNSHLASSTVWSHSLCTLVSAESKTFVVLNTDVGTQVFKRIQCY